MADSACEAIRRNCVHGRPPGRPRHPLSPPEVSEESQAFNNLNGCSPEDGNGQSELAPAEPSPGWAAPQQGGPSRRRSHRIVSHGAAAGSSMLVGAVTAASHLSGPAGVRAPARVACYPAQCTQAAQAPRRVSAADA
ncbi:hypothetical protein NDU88_001952 [Pleurodeles waltl]|uniref:Uncharacterized protein n=1 Tax=Pleurodeles waltl TaxID=8319 RepID=A0AAV7W0F1_PLEWA|nr:hypothetical protein NDU88_001952 [Pleurodeles waltl]